MTTRKLQRERLLALRADLPDRVQRERDLGARIADWLAHADARALASSGRSAASPTCATSSPTGSSPDSHRVAALPVVEGDALEFHAWTREAPMRAAEFGIPVPAHGRPVQPDALLIPCVGFDAQRYRLGYGGGYYDRTLARTVPWPLWVGIAFECGRLDTIEPRPHDMQLDVVITDAVID